MAVDEPRSEKSRKWVFTLNNPTDIEILQLKDWALPQYTTWGVEWGATGTKHLQGFLYFPNCVRFMTIKKLFPRMHLELCRGTIDQAIYYCHKGAGEKQADGTYVNYGLDADIYEGGVKPSIDNQRKGMIYSVETAMDITDRPISPQDRELLNHILYDLAIEINHPVDDTYTDHALCESDDDEIPDYVDLTIKRTKY